MRKNKSQNHSNDPYCLNRVREALTKFRGPNSNIELDLKNTFDEKTSTLMQVLPPLTYWYMDGKKRKKAYVIFNYCPFCGKKMT